MQDSLLNIYCTSVKLQLIIIYEFGYKEKGTHHLDASITGNCLAWLASFMLHLHLPLIEGSTEYHDLF